MTTVRRLRIISALIGALAILVAGCSSGDTFGRPDPQTTYAAIIDVRTPAEFASGHVDGARNLDVQSPAFASDIAALAASGTYVVYCRSGNRSAQAKKLMEGAGLSVIDGGGLTDMQSAGFPVTA